jgi:hypothetical protein
MNFERLANILSRYIDLTKPEGSKLGVSYVADKLTQSRVTNSILESVKDYQAFRLCYIVYLMQDGFSYEEAFEKTRKIYYIITDEVDEEKYETSDCDWCSGGENTCDHCDGNRTVECSECYGTGEVSDDGEDVTCSSCGGDGEEECGYCDGNGRVDCEECDGKGEIETNEKVYEIKQNVWTTINLNTYNRLTKMSEEGTWVNDLYEDEVFKSGDDWILTEGKNTYELSEDEVGDDTIYQNYSKVGGTGIVSKDNLVLSGISNRFSVMVLN